MIIGAGLAGLIAAHAFPRHTIVEAQPEPTAAHKALLRFRSAAVGELTGIEFKPVTVRKGIWLDGDWQHPNIRAANLYSRKVLGALLDRSIWKLDAATRYVAPEDFYERLIDAARHRITWGVQFDFRADEPMISTAPMPVTLRALGLQLGETFHRAGISVERFHVPRAAVYQTVYFPSPAHSLYRASMTGDLLICEFSGEPVGDWFDDVAAAMALPLDGMERLESVKQSYGKIAPIDDGKRKAVIAQLTADHNVFSLGRFATWRNILLDDVVHDIAVIKRLLNATHYERRLASL